MEMICFFSGSLPAAPCLDRMEAICECETQVRGSGEEGSALQEQTDSQVSFATPVHTFSSMVPACLRNLSPRGTEALSSTFFHPTSSSLASTL